MAERSEEPLLEKVYYHNCPGCIQELKNESARGRGIPYREFFYIWLITLSTVLAISVLFPFLYFMIRDLKIAKREEDIGFYAGFLSASFMLGRALTSTAWGIVGDRYGRKPVMIIGTITVIIFNTLFGLSVNYWMAILTRFLLGALNGLLGPIRAYSIEVCNKEHQAIAISLVATAWAIGLIVGPAIGGYLSQPADKYPNIIFIQPFFKRFPYFLPCLCITLFAIAALISCMWFPYISPQKIQQNLLKNWPLMSSIILFCIFCLDDTAYIEIFSLWAESDKKFGGLSFSSEDVGQVFAISGFSLLLFQLSIYPKVNRLMGPIILARFCAVLSIPLLFGYPFMTYLSEPTLSIVVSCASTLKNILLKADQIGLLLELVTIINGTFILQNNAVPQDQRGAANGIAMTAMSLFKAVAPAAAGVMSVAFRPKNKMEKTWVPN